VYTDLDVEFKIEVVSGNGEKADCTLNQGSDDVALISSKLKNGGAPKSPSTGSLLGRSRGGDLCL
jgi:hypothetical protein